MKWIFDVLKVWWVSLKSAVQLSYGVFKLRRLKQPIVGVFGGIGAYEGGKYAAWAKEFSKKIAQQKMSVVTGGGPGIMEAASCGAYEGGDKKKGFTLGIGVSGVDVGFKSEYAPLVRVDYFFVRKWLLTHYTSSYVFFPGGIGTVDELFEVLNLIKLKKIKRVPIILIGTNYWKDLVEWYEHALAYDLIEAPFESNVIITNDIDEAVRIVVSSC